MRKIDTDALQGVAPTLGVGNPITAVSQTDFQDDVLQQVLEVSRMVRRARAFVPPDGIAMLQLQCVSLAGSAETDTLDPYDVAVAGPPWPTPDQARDFDLWIVDYSAESNGTGNLTSACFEIQNVKIFGGGTVNDLLKLAWTDEGAPGGQTNYLQHFDGNFKRDFAPYRVPRGSLLRFCTLSSGAGTYNLFLMCIWAPRGLGQDVVGGY